MVDLGETGESVVPVKKSWPGAMWEWASLVDLDEGQNWRKCCTCAEKLARCKVGMGRFGGLGRGAKLAKVLYLCTKMARGKVGMDEFEPLNQFWAIKTTVRF